MTNQKTILLTALIEQLKDDVAPEMKIDDYFEIFSNEQILKEYDLSYEEISEIMEVPKQSVGSLVLRGKKLLRKKLLEKRGIS